MQRPAPLLLTEVLQKAQKQLWKSGTKALDPLNPNKGAAEMKTMRKYEAHFGAAGTQKRVSLTAEQRCACRSQLCGPPSFTWI